MSTQTEALKLALEALEGWGKGFPDNWGDLDTEAVTAIKEALAQPEQEPVAWRSIIPPEKHTDPFESARVLDFNSGWNECRHSVLQTLDSISTPPQPKEPEQRNASEHLEPVAIHQWRHKKIPNDAWTDDTYEAAYCAPSLFEARTVYTTPPKRKPEQEPVAWMKEGWGPDCGPYIEFYRDDEMGWRDRKEWTPLYTITPQRKPLTFDEIEACFPDGGGTNEHGEAVVSAQWLHDFAAAVQRAAHGIKE